MLLLPWLPQPWQVVLPFAQMFAQALLEGVFWPCLRGSSLTAPQRDVLLRLAEECLPAPDLGCLLADILDSTEWRSMKGFVCTALIELLQVSG